VDAVSRIIDTLTDTTGSDEPASVANREARATARVGRTPSRTASRWMRRTPARRKSHLDQLSPKKGVACRAATCGRTRTPLLFAIDPSVVSNVLRRYPAPCPERKAVTIDRARVDP
jgi:hypothetical protein